MFVCEKEREVIYVYVVVVELLSHVQPFSTPWTAAGQASLSFTISWSLLKLMSIESVMLSNNVVPFSSCPQSFPSSVSFPMGQFFASGSQNTGVSASESVLLMNTRDQFLFRWTGWTSLQSKGLSRVSNTTIQNHQFFGSQISL